MRSAELCACLATSTPCTRAPHFLVPRLMMECFLLVFWYQVMSLEEPSMWCPADVHVALSFFAPGATCQLHKVPPKRFSHGNPYVTSASDRNHQQLNYNLAQCWRQILLTSPALGSKPSKPTSAGKRSVLFTQCLPPHPLPYHFHPTSLAAATSHTTQMRANALPRAHVRKYTYELLCTRMTGPPPMDLRPIAALLLLDKAAATCSG